MKLGLIAFEALTVAALIGVLRHLGRPLTRVAVYAWHPLPIWEIAGSGHVDIAMCALLIAGFLLVPARPHPACGRRRDAGGLVKPTALLALPVLWRPWNWRLPLVVALTIALAYLPYLSVGSGVLGYLGGYINEEGFDIGRGFALLWLMESYTGYLPGAVYVYTTAAAAIMVGLADCRRLPQGPVAGDGARVPQLAARGVPGARVAALPLVLPRARSRARAAIRSATGWVLTLGAPLLYDSAAGTGWLGSDVRLALFTFAPVAALAFDAWRLRRTSLKRNAGETHERTFERAPNQAHGRGGNRPASVS